MSIDIRELKRLWLATPMHDVKFQGRAWKMSKESVASIEAVLQVMAYMHNRTPEIIEALRDKERLDKLERGKLDLCCTIHDRWRVYKASGATPGEFGCVRAAIDAMEEEG